MHTTSEILVAFQEFHQLPPGLDYHRRVRASYFAVHKGDDMVECLL